eukprot:2087005-Pleurochrysis_carterae.AAC.5
MKCETHFPGSFCLLEHLVQDVWLGLLSASAAQASAVSDAKPPVHDGGVRIATFFDAREFEEHRDDRMRFACKHASTWF